MVNTVRVVVGLLGVGLMIAGLAGVATGAWADGLWSIVAGAVVVVAVVLERSRYRSEAAERSDAAPGPGGGEPSAPQAPFRPTDEVFVDPTSGHRLRVYLDPATGERRYHAEGER
ncbi:MAG: hypothetical protein ACXWWU_07195 [Candidatus Limnocylindria bacterium]